MSLFDSFVIIGSVITFLIVAVLLGLTLSAFNLSLDASDLPEEAKEMAGVMDANWAGGVQWIFVGLLVGLPLLSMVLAHINSIPSVFFFISLGFLFLMTIVGWAFRAAWLNVKAGGGDFAFYVVDRMQLVDFVMSNFGVYTLFIILLIGYGTYVKLGGAQQW
jgi:hypothetical protein